MLFIPRIVIEVNCDEKPFPDIPYSSPGVAAARAVMSLIPLWLSSSPPRAAMLMGTLSTDSSRRVALTTTSCSAELEVLSVDSSLDCASDDASRPVINEIVEMTAGENVIPLLILDSLCAVACIASFCGPGTRLVMNT